MLEEIIGSVIFFLKKEYERSYFHQIVDSFFERLHLKEIPRLDIISLPERIVSPYLFIIVLIAFLGISDHGLSRMGILGFVMAISGFLLGIFSRNLRRPKISEKYFLPLLILFLICLAGLFNDWSLFLKISLIPLVLLFLTGHHTRELFIMVFLGSMVILYKGFWGIALPYLFLSLLVLATTIHGTIFDRNVRVIAFSCTFIGIFFWGLDSLLFGGFPLLSPEARGSLDATYTMLSHLLPVGCVMTIIITRNRTASLILVGISLVLMALLGYRTQVVLVMLASCFAAFIVKVISGSETIFLLFGTGGMAVFLTALRDVILQTRIGILQAIQARISLSLDIYDMMAEMGGILGYTKGQVYVAAFPYFARMMPGIAYSPRWYIAEMVGMDTSATSTILGPLAVDFGLVGIFTGMVLLGYLLSKLYWKKTPLGTALYSIILAYSLLGIETGIVDLEVLALFFLAFLYVLTSTEGDRIHSD
ncbi:MAG: oligosaccharide repeat unit polymerase [Theionarchaea archaeon]|nr:oligosaccharide repeat unit polymerase [Theionarchaea archaeon]